MPAIQVRIPKALHEAIPHGASASSVVRQLVSSAAQTPAVLVSAIASRIEFRAPDSEGGRFAIYITEDERRQAAELASRFLLSLNQVIQILLEDMLYRAGLWPIELDNPAQKD